MSDLVPKSTLEKFPEHVQAIGMISIEIANLDMLLGDLLAALLVLPTTLGQQIYLTPRAAIGRVEIIENVIDMIFVEGSEGRKIVESLLKRAKKIIGKRHDLIHNAWGTAKDNPSEVRRRSLPSSPEEPGEIVALRDLRRMIDEIRILSRDLEKPINDARAMFPPDAWAKRGVKETPS